MYIGMVTPELKFDWRVRLRGELNKLNEKYKRRRGRLLELERDLKREELDITPDTAQ